MKHLLLIAGMGLLIMSSCQKKDSDPSLTTLSAIPTSVSTCTAVAQIDSRGSYAITDHGFIYYYNNSDNIGYLPSSNTISLGKTISKDTFAASFTLQNSGYSYSGYKWYVRSYITNSKGTLYGNAVSFDPLYLSVSSVYPASAKTGDTITINGMNFDPDTSKDQVQFYNGNYITAEVVSATSTKLKVIVPNLSNVSYYYYSNSYNIIVTVGGQQSTLSGAFSQLLSVTGFSPSHGSFGTNISIYGTNLGQVTSAFLGNLGISINNYNNSQINFTVPSNITTKTFNIYVYNGSVKMLVPGGVFTMDSMNITSVSPSKVYPGGSITINGSNFNTDYSYDSVYLGSNLLQTGYSYPSTVLNATVPSSISPGTYRLKVANGLGLITTAFNVNVVVPTITDISPDSGYWNSDLTILGHNLNTNYSSVYFGQSTNYAESEDSLSFTVKVPYITPGTYHISLYSGTGEIQSPVDFKIIAPVVSSISPVSGAAGTSVIISGKGFGSNNNISVYFGNLNASILSREDTEIDAQVPPSIGSGSWLVTVYINDYKLSQSLTFSVP